MQSSNEIIAGILKFLPEPMLSIFSKFTDSKKLDERSLTIYTLKFTQFRGVPHKHKANVHEVANKDG